MYCDWPKPTKCCFCLPLRKGVLILAYTNIVFCAFMIGLTSYTIHHNQAPALFLYSRLLNFPAELCITIYCADILFNIVLIYGVHKESAIHIKAYYYFALTSTMAVVVLQFLDVLGERFQYYIILDMLLTTFTGLCMQLYFIIIVRSLFKKIEADGSHMYDNQLHQIVTGELVLDTNEVYNNLSTPIEVKN